MDRLPIVDCLVIVRRDEDGGHVETTDPTRRDHRRGVSGGRVNRDKT